MSHVSPVFAPVFGNCLKMLRQVLFTEKGQPFIISGSGTLGWDLTAANLIERDEKALVVNSGYFGDAFADCFEAYGVHADQLKAPVGGRPSIDEIEKALKSSQYAVLTFTHVDTCAFPLVVFVSSVISRETTATGVLADAKAIAELVKRVSPQTLVVLDGVCSVASEEIRMDAWGIDVVSRCTVQRRDRAHYDHYG